MKHYNVEISPDFFMRLHNIDTSIKKPDYCDLVCIKTFYSFENKNARQAAFDFAKDLFKGQARVFVVTCGKMVKGNNIRRIIEVK